MNVSELKGVQLDLWVARAEGLSVTYKPGASTIWLEERSSDDIYWQPSVDWSQGGPLIDKYRLAVSPFYYKHNNGWAVADADDSILSEGSTPLEAVCREVVRAKFGDDVPDNELFT